MFSRFRSMFGLERRSTGAWGELGAMLAVANETAAGIAVNAATALEYAPVLAAVRLIAESVGQLPVHLFERSGDDRRRAEDHPLERLLTCQPAPWVTPFAFKTDLTAALLLHGEAFALVSRASDGRILELVPLPHGAVTVDPASDLMPSYFLTLANGTRRPLERGEVFHLRGLGIFPNQGLSLVQVGRDAIALGIALNRHAAQIMARGARPSGVVTLAGRVSDPVLTRLRESVRTRHAGQSAGDTMILEEGAKFEPLTFSSVDIEFQAMREFQVAEVSRIFRVPLSLLSEMSRVTHANAESLGQQFLSLTLLPYLRLWSETIARDLLTEAEQPRFYAEFTTGALEMANLGERIDALCKSVAGGLMTADEARGRENLPPQGGEAAKLRFPLNTGSEGASHVA